MPSDADLAISGMTAGSTLVFRFPSFLLFCWFFGLCWSLICSFPGYYSASCEILHFTAHSNSPVYYVLAKFFRWLFPFLADWKVFLAYLLLLQRGSSIVLLNIVFSFFHSDCPRFTRHSLNTASVMHSRLSHSAGVFPVL